MLEKSLIHLFENLCLLCLEIDLAKYGKMVANRKPHETNLYNTLKSTCKIVIT